MQTDLEVTQEIAAPPERVWGRLLDPQFISSCAPGIEKVDPTGENQFRVTVGTGVGPFRLRIKLDVALSDLVAPKSLRLSVAGKAHGSEIKAGGTVSLEYLDGGRTRLVCNTTI